MARIPTGAECAYCIKPATGRLADGMLVCEGHRWLGAPGADVLLAAFRESAPAEPRWRYFEHRDWLYGWSTERMQDGRFAAFIYRPTLWDDAGRATSWAVAKEIHFAKRSTAKARARRWYDGSRQRASGRPPAALLAP